jgi:hypothetical protein
MAQHKFEMGKSDRGWRVFDTATNRTVSVMGVLQDGLEAWAAYNLVGLLNDRMIHTDATAPRRAVQ